MFKLLGNRDKMPATRGTPGLEIDPLAAVGGEQMQLLAWRDRPDSLADRGGDCAGDPHDHLARRQFPGIGGDALQLVLAGTVDEGLGPDALDRLHREVEIVSLEITKSSGRIPRMPASPAARYRASCDLISSERSGSKFIGGAPMKEATKVVAGF